MTRYRGQRLPEEFGWFRQNPVSIERLRPYQEKAVEAVKAALARCAAAVSKPWPAGEILGIRLLDHIVFNQKGYYSFLEKELV